MKKQNFRKFVWAAFIGFFSAGLAASAVMAEGMWYRFKSETGVFEVNMPEENEIKTQSFRTAFDRVIHTSEVSAVIDQRPYKDAVKRYIIKLDQTLGPPLKDRNTVVLVDEQLKAIEDTYKMYNGVVKQKEKGLFSGKVGGEIYMTYEDPDLGEQAIRARILYSDMSKLEQIIMGPDHVMFAYKSRDFFDSLNFYGGVTRDTGSFGEDWENHTSPFELFTLKLPKISEPYFREKPQIQNSDKVELISAYFYDPVWSYKILYNVYGYRFTTRLNNARALEVLIKNHISKYGYKYRYQDFQKRIDNNSSIIEIAMPVNPSPEMYYVNYSSVRATIRGNFLVIQEVMGYHPLIASNFVENLFDQIEIHEDRAKESWVREMSERRMQQIQQQEQKPAEQPEQN